MNDRLYLHYKGFRRIENLDEYTGVKVLWLEGNGIYKIENLENQTALKCLFLHENSIEKIEGLDNQPELDNLNLSKNYIRKVENIAHLKKLSTLNLSNNVLVSLDDVRELVRCTSLQALDLQHNQLNDPQIVELLAQLPDLRVLHLIGNPVVKLIKNYRRITVAKCKLLKYLDDRPVFDEERRRTDAWMVGFELGGLAAASEAEQNELRIIRQEKEAADERNFRGMEQILLEGRKIRQQQKELKRLELEGVSNLENVSNGNTNDGSTVSTFEKKKYEDDSSDDDSNIDANEEEDEGVGITEVKSNKNKNDIFDFEGASVSGPIAPKSSKASPQSSSDSPKIKVGGSSKNSGDTRQGSSKFMDLLSESMPSSTLIPPPNDTFESDMNSLD